MLVPRLIAAVYVQDPCTREELILLPGDEPSPELAALVTNPDAWEASPGECGPEPFAVGEPDTSGQKPADLEAGEASGDGPKKSVPRRARSSSAS
ncbi:hypothetical protein [Streptomyces tubercidicus]